MPLRERQRLGLILGRLGDPRIVLDLREPEAYVEIPAGEYAYQNGRQTIKTPFRISRYPVTNSQFALFIAEGGYENASWWSEEGWQWREKERVSEPAVLAQSQMERSQSARGRRLVLGGGGVLQVGRRTAAHRTRMGSRRARARRIRIPLGHQLGGRHLQHLGGRPGRDDAGRAFPALAQPALWP